MACFPRESEVDSGSGLRAAAALGPPSPAAPQRSGVESLPGHRHRGDVRAVVQVPLGRKRSHHRLCASEKLAEVGVMTVCDSARFGEKGSGLGLGHQGRPRLLSVLDRARPGHPSTLMLRTDIDRRLARVADPPTCVRH